MYQPKSSVYYHWHWFAYIIQNIYVCSKNVSNNFKAEKKWCNEVLNMADLETAIFGYCWVNKNVCFSFCMLKYMFKPILINDFKWIIQDIWSILGSFHGQILLKRFIFGGLTFWRKIKWIESSRNMKFIHNVD